MGRQVIAREIKSDNGYRTVWLWCPGCDSLHSVCIEDPIGNHPAWVFNQNLDAPTFHPSLLVTRGHYVSGTLQKGCSKCAEDRAGCLRCHSFIVDGQWKFLDDCSHRLAGQTVPIPELPAPWNGEADTEGDLGPLRTGY